MTNIIKSQLYNMTQILMQNSREDKLDISIFGSELF